MLIVDAQVHIWANHKPTNANHRQVETYSADDLLAEMDEAGVHAAVIHPPASWDPDSNELAVEAARRHPDRLAILGNFPLDDPASRGRVDGWKQRPGMLGLRFALLAATYLPTVGQIAERHPRLKLIVDHLGRPSGTKDDAAWANLPEMLALARHPNVAIKATGAPSYSSAPYPYRNIHDHLRRIHDAFGPARMFWGTDITRMPCPWRQCVTLFTEQLPWLRGRDLELVMGRGVCDWLGWPLPPR